MTSSAEIPVSSGEVRIPVGEISPSSMAAFLNEFRPGLEFNPVPTYPKIFSKLRDLPFDEQEKLLVGFYSQKVEAFPNGEELGKFLARINNISWFQPEIQPDRESLENLCRQTLSRLNLPDLTLRIIKEARWYTARGAARGAARYAAPDATRDATRDAARGAALFRARDAAQYAARYAARDAARKAAREAVLDAEWDAAWSAARDAARGAEWIIVKDLMPQRGYDKGNPFEPLIEIYELGCWPIGIVPGQDGNKEFVIFVPPSQKAA